MLKANLFILYTALHLTVTLSDSIRQKDAAVLTRGLFASHLPVKNGCPHRAGLPSVEVAGTCFYFVHLFQTDWITALRYCRRNGLKLAMILSKEEHDSIVYHIKKSGLKAMHFWISGTDLGTEGRFYWFEYDQPFMYTHWLVGHPDNGKSESASEGENCVEIRSQSNPFVKMFRPDLFILYTVMHLTVALPSSTDQKEPAILTKGLFTSHLTAKNECPHRVALPSVRIGGTCFYLGYSIEGDWYDALRFCRSNGMKFARILSSEEHDSIVSHIKKIGKTNSSFWISGTDLGNEGQFYWFEYDQPMMYTNWNQTQPDNNKNKNPDGENCLELAAEISHRWNDEYCSTRRSFICELR